MGSARPASRLERSKPLPAVKDGAVARGRRAGVPAEDAGEVRLIGEPRGGRDVRERLGGLGEQAARVLDAKAPHVLPHALAGVPSKRAREVHRVYARFARELEERLALGEALAEARRDVTDGSRGRGGLLGRSASTRSATSDSTAIGLHGPSRRRRSSSVAIDEAAPAVRLGTASRRSPTSDAAMASTLKHALSRSSNASSCSTLAGRGARSRGRTRRRAIPAAR